MTCDLTQPYQGCKCDRHKAIRQQIRKRRGVGQRGYVGRVDAIGAKRRIQALACIGWAPSYVVAQIGGSRALATQILDGTHETISIRTHRKIAEVYNRLSMTPAVPSRWSNRVRNRANKNRWAPPLAWDDETIDDPAAKPVGVPRKRTA